MRNRLATAILLLCIVFSWSAFAAGQAAKGDIPRNRTLISQGWDLYNQLPSPNNFNPYAGTLLHLRNILHYTVLENLFYTNYATGEIIPWQGRSWEYNSANTEVTLKLREGVKWSDGQPFTADDVVFTVDMLIRNAPAMAMSSALKEWVKTATAVDPLTVKFVLTKPGPRWARDVFATQQNVRFVTVPEAHLEGRGGSQDASSTSTSPRAGRSARDPTA